MINIPTLNRISIITLLVVLAACDKTRVFEKNLPVEGDGWHKDSTAYFYWEIEDTANFYNVLINVRHLTGYSYRNLYLFIDWYSPSKKHARDTFNIILADEKGKWLGEGSGNVRFRTAPYKIGVKFPEPGRYVLKIKQAMRHEQLKGILDLGVRVEKGVPLTNQYEN
ncbi:MAG: gliding motility lipoprotein GldH [Vicingaceae bacterium]|nr:MAG: gliding motility lipoprotein GldH [Vicingaceae bacterium]